MVTRSLSSIKNHKSIKKDPLLSQIYDPYSLNVPFQKPVNASLKNTGKLKLQEIEKKAGILRNLKQLNEEIQTEIRVSQTERDLIKVVLLPEIKTERNTSKSVRFNDVLEFYQPRALIKPLRQSMNKNIRE